MFHRFSLYRIAAMLVLLGVAIKDYRQAYDVRAAPSDFVKDYLSGRALFAGRSIYEPIPEDSSVAPGYGLGDVVNDHPPTYVLAPAPLALLRYDHAFLVLSALSLAAGAAGGWLVGREIGLCSGRACWVSAALLLHPGAQTCLTTGSISLLLLLAVVAGWMALRRGVNGWAGAAIGLAAALKLYPALLAVGFLVVGRYRALAAFVIVLVLMCSVVTAGVGLGDVVHYPTERIPANSRAYRGQAYNLSWVGVAHRTFGEPSPFPPNVERVAVWPEVATVVAVGGQIVLLAVAGLALLCDPRRRTPDRVFAVLIPTMLLVCPLTWLHAIPFLLIPAAVLGREAWTTRRYGLLLALATCIALTWVDDLALSVRLIDAIGGDDLPWWTNLLLLAPTWGTFGVLALSLWPTRDE